ncbi:uncharacterized protein FOMMEDRAFT_164781 [Fomitiporia mediterranea MF3/22]|uniref:uncharacterized protein n=1 Tax=Fomitiporia mediterranea (strain MF3/22) TaxID=694068 RepID=UPI0004408639|nr:uncharacterized protein FOMMEDRAFT_164781 [Fomitiporia mediterranea MF3/22]EJD07998.1 hypothetical protein FOMMEDRAFT_164781 [Fomitiporia mediterranea MF3/22]
MGLAGRKQKQRIGADPRNLTWADDAAKFGQTYLAKLGWDPSRGLGASGDGRTSHIKVVQKLNMLGIGAGAKQEGDVAWKQNRDYEMLLKRLNEGLEGGKDDIGQAEDDESKVDADGDKGDEIQVKKKRKRKQDVDVDAEDEEKRRQKREKKGKKAKREKEKLDSEKVEELVTTDEKAGPSEQPASALVIQAPTPRPMAHRARFLRSKKLASHSSTAVAEILGIATSSSNTPVAFGSATPFPPSSDSSTPVTEADQEIRTSSISVGDYFREKLASRANSRIAAASPLSSSIIPQDPTNAVDNGTAGTCSYDEDNAPRRGLGSRAIHVPQTAAKDDEDVPRAGLGMKFGMLMGGFTRPDSTPASSAETPEESQPDDGKEKKGKKKKKRKDRASEKLVEDDSPKDTSTEVRDDQEDARKKDKAARREKKQKDKEKKKREQYTEEDL